MKIQFQINYFTNTNQVLMLAGNRPEVGNMLESEALEMMPLRDGNWALTLEINDSEWFEYRYFIRSFNKTERREFGPSHRVKLNAKDINCLIFDFWQAESHMPFLYSSAFTDSIFAAHQEPRFIKYEAGRVLLKVHAPFVRKHQSVAISGDNALFGAWHPEKLLKMHSEQFPVWAISIDANELPILSNFKFVVVDKNNEKDTQYEWGEPRILTVPQNMDNLLIIHDGMTFRFQEAPWKGSGFAIPVFSLRSKNSWGCGDFGDLYKMIDWSVDVGFQIIQTLPLNDTSLTGTWKDSYPYSAISSCALHPIYCCMGELPTLNDVALMDSLTKKGQQLNELKTLDYEQVLQLKWKYFKTLFQQEGAELLQTAEFITFFDSNRDWLVPYAAFCYLRWKTGLSDFRDWGEWSSFNLEKIKALVSPLSENYPEISIHYFIQYYLDKQLRKVKLHGHEHAVVLKGDIPIGVSRYSVEAWSESALFNMDAQVGAPPDDFSAIGQNWGFPSYNWDVMKKDNYRWWKRRFNKMADYFDAYRIDHILGFFRIWEIPSHAVDGLLGHFSPALPISADEMGHFGFQFDAPSMTQPFLTENLLHYHFGKKTNIVVRSFLKKRQDERYELKKNVATQQQLKSYFGTGVLDADVKLLMEKLFSLCTEVLFVEDSVQRGFFHPRISAFSTERFRWLKDEQKQAFTKLYNTFYFERNLDFWKEKALEKLTPLIHSTRMLACGEDLGMIPACVPEVMNQLGILSLEIQQMPKTFGVMFENLNNIPYESVSTTSTHDMTPIRAWWLENRKRTQQYYNQVLWKVGDAPWECTPEIATQIVRNQLFSPAILVILPWQDWMATDSKLRNPDPLSERINIPSNPDNNWCYRMHISIEELRNSKVFNAGLKKAILQSGRG